MKKNRGSIRLKGYDYSQPGAYFVTICAHNKNNLFGEIVNGEMVLNEHGRIVGLFWQRISNRYPLSKLNAFVVMPNHIHGIIIIKHNNVGAIHELPLQNNIFQYNRRNMLLPKIVGYFKMNTAKHINQLRNTTNTPVWQRNYYEHIIRNDHKLNQIRQYIINNPLNWDDDKNNPKNMQQKNYISAP